jgi:hypothetical protein
VNHGVTEAGVIAAFHERRVLPLMERARRLGEKVPSTPIKGMALSSEQLIFEEIKKHIKVGLRSVPDDAALDLCPPMHLDHGFIEMVSTFLLLVPLDFFTLPDPRLGRL